MKSTYSITVYVAKTEEEKKTLEASLEKKREEFGVGRIDIGAILGSPPQKK